MKSWQQYNMSSKPSSRTSLKTKTSLRDTKKSIEGTQHSSNFITNTNLFSHQGKKSLKDLHVLINSTISKTQHYQSINYSDIRVAVIKQYSFFVNLFCNNKQKNQIEGCSCQPKCLWIKHWLSLSTHTPLNQVRFLISKQLDGEIRRDILRTQPECASFHNTQYQQALYQCLRAYAQIDPEIGYIQGMNIICSVLIYHGTNYIDCLHIFKTLMINCGFRKLLIQNFTFAQKLSTWLKQCLKFRCYDLYTHMIQQNGVNIEIFSIGWLIPMMGNIIPLSQMHLVINIFMEKGWTSLIKIIITMFLYLKQQILAINDEGQLMHMLCTQKLRKRQINWQEVIKSSCNIKNLPIFL